VHILGIESSCDETGAAVVRDGRDVLSNVIASQDDLHVEYGGVVPEIASRAHVERILPVVRRALADAGIGYGDINAIAVGNRPGLIGSLLVGLAAAKGLAWSLGKPLVGVDHIHAHLYAASLDREPPAFPALGLVISGGHTTLYRLESWLSIARLGSTIDDAVGEAYDKVGTILGLAYPGGPKLDRLAQEGDERAHDFPVSDLGPDSLDFSFSGIKTAVLYTVRGRPERRGEETVFPRDESDLSEREQADVAASFQRAAVEALLRKTRRALEAGESRSLLIGGGVSANSRVRQVFPRLADEFGVELRIPPLRYCLDNAAMIAGLAHERLQAGEMDDLSLEAAPTTAM